MSRILLISLSNIGDVVLTTPVLEALHRRWPAAAITVLVGPRAAALFERDPRAAHVIPYDKTMSAWRTLALVARLRRSRFDVIVDLRHGLLPLLIGARRLSPLVRTGQAAGHRTQVHLDVIRRMGIPTDGVAPRLLIGPEDDAAVAPWVAGLPAGAPLVAVAPGARSHLKRWTADRFATVCDALIAEDGAQVMIVGDAEDQPVAEQVIQMMRRPPVNLVGRTTLRQLAALFRRVRVVLTNDSACLHIAGAVGTPTVALFGPTDPIKYGPLGPHDAVVRLALVCSPCERALCPYAHECMRWLPAHEVLAAARKVLQQVTSDK